MSRLPGASPSTPQSPETKPESGDPVSRSLASKKKLGPRLGGDERRGLCPRLLGRLHQYRRAGAELRQQRRLLGLGSRERAHLDMAEAADLVRNGGERDREMVV